MENLKVGWGMRARKYEKKIQAMDDSRWVKICWKEKQREGWMDLYGKERERYYNRNWWGTLAIDSMVLEERNLCKELWARER